MTPSPSTQVPTQRPPRWRDALALLLLAFALQWPLASNPGYFSHDELQWAQAARLGFDPWRDVAAFQYRPLTFQSWIWLSRAFFEQPRAFHCVLVLWGSANAALLFALGRRLGVARVPAACGALVFALGPFAAYVHGWVGTIADLAWVTFALLITHVVLDARRRVAASALVAALTALALLAKEAAFAIPPLLLLAGLLDAPRRRQWWSAMLAAGTVCACYLLWRWDILLHAPRAGAQYRLSAAHVPLRWLEYQLFPPIPTVFEAFNTLASGVGKRQAASALLWSALVAAAWRAHPRLAAWFVLGGIASLLPVLPLGAAWNHYGYGFAALAAMAIAAAWDRTPAWGRAAIACCALLALWHGVNVSRMIRHVGGVQARFSPALADALRSRPGVLRLRLPDTGEDWIYRRLSHEVPAYGGVAIGDRVQLVEAGQPADARITEDGRIAPLR